MMSVGPGEKKVAHDMIAQVVEYEHKQSNIRLATIDLACDDHSTRRNMVDTRPIQRVIKVGLHASLL